MHVSFVQKVDEFQSTTSWLLKNIVDFQSTYLLDSGLPTD